MPDYTPTAASALGKAFTGAVVTDFIDYPVYSQSRWDGKFGSYPIQNEILGLWASTVAPALYSQTYTCLAGLAVGSPVYVSANNTVALALATTVTTARVVGFVEYKPTTTSCRLSHFYYAAGLSGGTAGGKVYLTNAGGFSATAGTVSKIVGEWISTTEALLSATPDVASASGAIIPNTLVVGDILYADTTSSLTRLADVATGNVLISGGVGVAPSWGKVGLTTHVTGILPATNGGTGLGGGVYTVGDILVANGISSFINLASGANNSFLRGTAIGSQPVWSTLILPNSAGAFGIVYASAVNTLDVLATAASGVLVTSAGSVPSISTDIPTAVTVGGAYNYRAGGTDVAVADGGTGLSTLTAHALYAGNGASAPTALAVGATNTVLHGNTGADPSFSAVSLTADVSGVLPVANGGTGKSSQPTFSAHRTSNQSITTGSEQKCQFNIVGWDTGSYYDNVTNFRYTPLVAGKYLITLITEIENLADGNLHYNAIYKNGSVYQYGTFNVQGAAGNTVNSLSTLIDFNGTTDYVEAYVFHNNAGSQNLNGTATQSRFQAARICA